MTNFPAPETIEVTCPPCVMCGKSAKVKVIPSQLAAWRGGELIQRAMPEMTADDREMLINGTHPACWDEMMGEEED
jgi:hypothetical protein